MNTKILVLVAIVTTALCLPTEIVPEQDTQKVDQISEQLAEEDRQTLPGEKFIFPFLHFSAQFVNSSRLRPPAPAPTQTIIVPPGTEVAVNSPSPITINKPGGTTVISTRK